MRGTPPLREVLRNLNKVLNVLVWNDDDFIDE